MRLKNGYPNPLIDNVFKAKINRLNYIKPNWPQKCPVFLFCLMQVKNRPRSKETQRK